MNLIKNTQFQENKAIVTYEFSDEDIEVLTHLKERGYMEFRGGKGSNIADNLLDYGFVETDDNAWHFTIQLSKLGQSVVDAMS